MRDHYDVLGIEENADELQIKKSYRKLALKYHPDKNQGNEEAVVALFREVQTAYDVLCDPQERAWYDKHKDALLMKSGVYEDKEVNVTSYFTPTCYKGFGDGELDFYAVFAKLFKELSEEDYTFMDAEEEDYPKFGNANTDCEFIVHEFYGFWQSFMTRKSYVWEEEYDTRQAPSRWVRRKMEQENAKKTEQARKERSREIQALADWVRRRDPRVKQFRVLLQERAKENEEKAKKKRDEKRMKDLIAAAKYEKENRQIFDENEARLADLERELGFDSSDDDYTDDSDEMMDEEKINNLTETEKEKIRLQMEKDDKVQANLDQLLQQDIERLELNESPDDEFIDAPKLSKKAKKRLKQRQKEEGILNESQPIITEPNKTEPGVTDPDVTEPSITEPSTINPPEPPTPEKKISAKEKRRLREKQRQEEAARKKTELKKLEPNDCKVCNEDFETRNQLFKHIKETGHAELKQQSAVPSSNKKKGKKK